jgi:hypothetical protein
MSKKSVLCIATSRNRAEQIIANLRTAHFSSKDLSIVFSDRSFLGEPGAEKDTRTGQWRVASAAEGGVEDVTLAWPGGLGTLIFAGVGRFTAAGPLLSALGRVATHSLIPQCEEGRKWRISSMTGVRVEART